MASMGKRSRDKGARIERQIVSLHDGIPCPAEKISRTGHTGPDMRIADQFLGESKARSGGSGFKTITRWLEGVDLLFLREDGEVRPTVVMRFDLYAKLMQAYLDHSVMENDE